MKRISLHNAHKRFRIGFKKRQSFLARLTAAFAGREQKREIVVLEDLSFDVMSGEILGIIGKNGSGKSTILRLIAGIYKLDSGNISTNGKIVSIINLGTALKERLTMRENIFLVGSLFGISQRDIKERFDSIVNFSELNDFVNTKIYQFSSGMLQRLAFSISVHSSPEILLLDEVFEVGDESFRGKSAKKIAELTSMGSSVVFVTHDLQMVRKQCHKVIWLADGRIKMQGKPNEVINLYEHQ